MNTLAKLGVFLMGVGMCAQAAMQFVTLAVLVAYPWEDTKSKKESSDMDWDLE